MKGLLVRREWVEKILSGEKTWELRGSSTKNLGEIALIQSGSGLVVGTCELVDIEGPLSRAELKRSEDRHCVDPRRFAGKPRYKSTHAWVLKKARRLRKPVAYQHPPGAVIWVNLSPQVSARVRRGK